MIDEKLATFAEAAEENSEFARTLPQFVSEFRYMFAPEEIEERLAQIEHEHLQRPTDAMDVYDPELDDLAASVSEARHFEFVKELLTAPALGKSCNPVPAGKPDREVLVGPVYARKLVRAFGEKVFDVIEAEPERMREVAGISSVFDRIARAKSDG